jgi:hypothetical protein
VWCSQRLSFEIGDADGKVGLQAINEMPRGSGQDIGRNIARAPASRSALGASRHRRQESRMTNIEEIRSKSISFSAPQTPGKRADLSSPLALRCHSILGREADRRCGRSRGGLQSFRTGIIPNDAPDD